MPLTVPGVVQVGNGAKWLTPGAGATSTKVKVDGIETTFGIFGSPDNVSQPSVKPCRNSPPTCSPPARSSAAWAPSPPLRKAGTNASHASVFGIFGNSATDARNAFATAKPFQNLHNYGGTVGGPVRRDKTFFFFDFDGVRGVSAFLFTPNVPTVAMRQGDFSAFAALKNPFTDVNPLAEHRCRCPSSPRRPSSPRTFLFPLPNFGAPSLTAANYRAFFDGPEVHRTEEIQLVYNFSASHRAFLRYENRQDDYHIARSALPLITVGPSDNHRRVNSGLRRCPHLPSASGGTNSAPASSSWSRPAVPLSPGRTFWSSSEFKACPMRADDKFPIFSVTGFSGDNINLLNPVNDGHAQMADNLSWVRGRHSMKFGAEDLNFFVNRFMPNTSGNPVFGSFAFTGKFTGNAYADFLLGLRYVTRPRAFRPVRPFPRLGRLRPGRLQGSPRLTLMYGLRWEYNGPAYALDGNLY